MVPGQQVIKIVNEELIQLSANPLLKFSGPKPHVIMMVGLQGSGKTISTRARSQKCSLGSKGERVMLVAGDPYRPAAVTQLQQPFGERIDVPVEFDLIVASPELVGRAFEKAQKGRIRRHYRGYRWTVAVGRGVDERVKVYRGESPADRNATGS
ncbi:MAG: hypothetical protein U0X87_13285 [Anaerolineales bacterium]